MASHVNVICDVVQGCAGIAKLLPQNQDTRKNGKTVHRISVAAKTDYFIYEASHNSFRLQSRIHKLTHVQLTYFIDEQTEFRRER